MIKRLYRPFKRFPGDRRGTPALEFALISPLLFAGVFGAVEMGRALWERNQFAAAASLATRELANDPSLTAAQIKTIINGELGYAPGELTLNITDANQSIAGQDFKRIEISYRFKFLVGLGYGLDGVDLKVTRFAPA